MSSESDSENIQSLDNQQETQPADQVNASDAPSAVDAGDSGILSNRRIAKNTIALYIRMILMTGIGLYTSRIVLQTLGVSDYGLYNAVGGIIGMFHIVTSSLSTAVSRYLTYSLGRGDKDRLKVVFSTSINIQLAIAIFIIVVAGTAGWFFLNYKMNVPDGRMDAANWMLVSCILSSAIGLICVPFGAAVVSHEKMDMYAYLSILDGTMKLLVSFSLYFSPIDKLKTYAVLLLSVSVLMSYIYICYCRRKFEECRYKFVYDRQLIKDMTKFAGWSFFGNGAWVLNTQGVSILINMFFGVTLNAARGIASQVEGLATTFVLMGSNIVLSALRKVIPDKVRIPAFIVIIASFVTLIGFLLEGFFPDLYDSLGIYLTLITVNCIIFGRAEMFSAWVLYVRFSEPVNGSE